MEEKILQRFDNERQTLMTAINQCLSEEVLDKLAEAIVLCRRNEVKEWFLGFFTEAMQKALLHIFGNEIELIDEIIRESGFCLYNPNRCDLISALRRMEYLIDEHVASTARS